MYSKQYHVASVVLWDKVNHSRLNVFLPQMLCERVLKNNLDKWLLSLFFT